MLFRSCFQHLCDVERKRIVTPANVKMRLNRGERPEPLPEHIRREIRARLRTKQLHEYPDYTPFYEKLSHYTGFRQEQIVVGAGIEEFIRTLMFLCCEPGQIAAVLWPSCAMYDIYAKAFGVRLAQIETAPGTTWHLEHLIGSLSMAGDRLRVVFLPNPSQPVEVYYNPDQLAILAAWCGEHDILLAIDEAHYGFGAETALPLIKHYNNLIVMRTFSKLFYGAGIRVGFCVGQERVIKPLHAVRPSGEITGPSITIASILLDHGQYMEDSASATAAARDWLRDMINNNAWQSLRVRAYGNYGFSVLIDFGSRVIATIVASRLADRGIYVKANFPEPVQDCILVSCGDMRLMQKFFVELQDVCLSGEKLGEGSIHESLGS